MTVFSFAFYMFAVITVAAGLMVTLSRNPVHSVLWLILAFLSTSGLFVLLGAEFVAMLLVIVYVGAVAVLFLFVVMMLDIDFAALKGELARYMPLGLLIGVVLLMQVAIGVDRCHRLIVGLVEIHHLDHAQIVERADHREHRADHRQPQHAGIDRRAQHRQLGPEAQQRRHAGQRGHDQQHQQVALQTKRGFMQPGCAQALQ